MIFKMILNLRVSIDKNRIIYMTKEIQDLELLKISNIYYLNLFLTLRKFAEHSLVIDSPNYISMVTELENVFRDKTLFYRKLYEFYSSILNEQNNSMKYPIENAVDDDYIAYILSEYSDEQEINSRTLVRKK